MIEAKIVCDSIGKCAPRLTTFNLRYPKFIHGEFMTHRMFSRNASSSRAIPVSKNLEEVRSDELRAAPVWWGKEQKGMASGDELDDIDTSCEVPFKDPIDNRYFNDYVTAREAARQAWRRAALKAASSAEGLVKLGAHKSIVNRILEPFLHINVVMTSCEPGLMNFFGLRLDGAAQPEIRTLAEQMWAAWNASKPQKLELGQWHLPFISAEDEWQAFCYNRYVGRDNSEELDEEGMLRLITHISVARCARVSYLSFETGKRSTIEEDQKLYGRLVGARPMHASPAEHQATPDVLLPRHGLDTLTYPEEWHKVGVWKRPDLHGNLPGWRQYRKMLEGEAVAPLPSEYQV